MTECERIIQQGVLPKSFFDEEQICDFFVDKKRKKIWAIELDLLIQFDKICKKHGLIYFLIGGTLLGAVRHHGFIPWDDDLDVAMPRKDYDLLMQLKDEFSEPYFLQTPYTDEGYYYSYNKNPLDVYKEMESIVRQFNDRNTEHIGLLACTTYNYNKLMFFLEDFDETLQWNYEGMLFPIPKGYKRVLQIEYGDYMRLPSKEERGRWHNKAIFDPDISYKNYMERLIY